MKLKYYVQITVNSPRGETDYKMMELDSIDGAIERALEMHPSATSLLISIVPNKDGMGATFNNNS